VPVLRHAHDHEREGGGVTTDRPEFADEQSALDWIERQVDDPYTDNLRVGYEDDPASMKLYDEAAGRGCCGSSDAEVLIAGRPALVGCNYGH
jgi:hypothetical protein